MTNQTDAQLIINRIQKLALDLDTIPLRGWNHMGAIIVDSALQRRQKYRSTVLPRVKDVVEKCSDATTEGFATWAEQHDLATEIRWNGEQRVEQIQSTLQAFRELGIDTVDQLREALTDTNLRKTFRARLREVKYVGLKTIDYFDILVGLDGVAIDGQIQAFARDSGVSNTEPGPLKETLIEVARSLGVKVGAVDYAIWTHQQSK